MLLLSLMHGPRHRHPPTLHARLLLLALQRLQLLQELLLLLRGGQGPTMRCCCC
jgi:hypothetical protein